MTDAEIIAQWSRVTDPKEALRLIVENEMFFGYDHYYRDLREALIDMAVRCGGMEPQPTNSELLRAAGYTQRDTSLECDECGRKFSTQMLPIHKCEPIDPHMIAAEDRYPDEPTEAQIKGGTDELIRFLGWDNEKIRAAGERIVRAAFAAKDE